MPGLGADESVVTLVSDCTAERRSFVVTPTCRPLALPKSYCFSSHLYSGVRLLAYYSHHLVYVFLRIAAQYLCARWMTIFQFLSAVRAHVAYHHAFFNV